MYEKKGIFAIMKKSMLYTRSGDRGTTALVGGSRVAKNCVRVCAYGSVDELNAHLGLAQAHARGVNGTERDVRLLGCAMSAMFCIGAYLATPSRMIKSDDEASEPDATNPGISDADVEALENAIDRLDASAPPQKTFILPGGCVAACQAHVARTVCRRAEREVLALADTGEYVHPLIERYLNRLSDYLFILARSLNHLSGVADIPWP